MRLFLEFFDVDANFTRSRLISVIGIIISPTFSQIVDFPKKLQNIFDF